MTSPSSAWEMTSLLNALGRTDQEACFDVASSLIAIIHAASASDRAAIAHESGSTYFELASVHSSWRISCRHNDGKYEAIIAQLGSATEADLAAFSSAADMAAFINSLTLGFPQIQHTMAMNT